MPAAVLERLELLKVVKPQNLVAADLAYVNSRTTGPTLIYKQWVFLVRL